MLCSLCSAVSTIQDYVFMWRFICFLTLENTVIIKLQQDVTFVTRLKAESPLLN